MIEKYEGLFKDTVSFQGEPTHIDDFNASPDENVDLNKPKESDAKELPTKDIEPGNEAAADEGADEAAVDDVEETYTQWLERNIHWVGEVIDLLSDAFYDVYF